MATFFIKNSVTCFSLPSKCPGLFWESSPNSLHLILVRLSIIYLLTPPQSWFQDPSWTEQNPVLNLYVVSCSSTAPIGVTELGECGSGAVCWGRLSATLQKRSQVERCKRDRVQMTSFQALAQPTWAPGLPVMGANKATSIHFFFFKSQSSFELDFYS